MYRCIALLAVISLLSILSFSIILVVQDHNEAIASWEDSSHARHTWNRTYFYDLLPGSTINPLSMQLQYKLNNGSSWIECNKRTTLSLAIIISAPKNVRRRNVIRKTWANPKYFNSTRLRSVFLIGRSPNDELHSSVEKEATMYKDVVIGSFLDSYRNLTYKTVTGLLWVQQWCNDLPWVIKVDDDVMVNPFHLRVFLENELRDRPQATAIYGNLQTKNKAMRNGKWNVTKAEYPETKYPKFVLGPSYILNRNTIDRLLAYVAHTPFLWLEDVFITGLVARNAKISHIDTGKTLYTSSKHRLASSNTQYSFWHSCPEKLMENTWNFILKHAPKLV